MYRSQILVVAVTNFSVEIIWMHSGGFGNNGDSEQVPASSSESVNQRFFDLVNKDVGHIIQLERRKEKKVEDKVWTIATFFELYQIKTAFYVHYPIIMG